MAIAHVADSWSISGGGATNVTGTIPSGTLTGHFMIAHTTRMGTDLELTWGNANNDWTKIAANYEALGRNTENAVWYKVATSDSEANPAFLIGTAPNNIMTCVINTFSGVDTTTPFDVVYSNTNHYVFTQNTGNPTPKPITTVTNGAWVYTAFGCTHDLLSAIAPPSGYTLRGYYNPIIYDRTNCTATKEIATAGLETPGSWNNTETGTVQESQCYTLAIRPAGTPDMSRPRHTYSRQHFIGLRR